MIFIVEFCFFPFLNKIHSNSEQLLESAEDVEGNNLNAELLGHSKEAVTLRDAGVSRSLGKEMPFSRAGIPSAQQSKAALLDCRLLECWLVRSEEIVLEI